MSTEGKINILPRTGLMRGARLWPDPDGILCSPFDEQGQKLGYVFIYGEDAPAVFDGTNWHSILPNPEAWDEMQDVVAAQYYKIVKHAEKNSAYEQLANYINGNV